MLFPWLSMVTMTGKSSTRMTQKASGVPNSSSLWTPVTSLTERAIEVPQPPTAWR